MSVAESTGAARPRRSASALAATAVAAATLLLASACGASSDGHGSSTASRYASAPSPPPVGGTGGRVAGASCEIRPGSVCLTERARGHTVQLTVGWTLTLRLGAPGRRFGAPRLAGGQALQALGPPRRSSTEVVAGFRAVKPGTVQLRATERPLCPAGRPCPDYVALWTLTVRVSAAHSVAERPRGISTPGSG